MVLNCIVYGNTASSDPQIGKSGNPIVKYSLVEGAYPGVGNIDTVPLFVSASTGAGNSYDGLSADWTLQSTSPCINQGAHPGSLSMDMYDIAGNFRYDEGHVDMGAYEYIASTVACGTISSNTTWSGTVLVTCDVSVASNATLTISPGTQVLFIGHHKLDIDGRLYAVGAQNNRIEFSAYNPSEG